MLETDFNQQLGESQCHIDKSGVEVTHDTRGHVRLTWPHLNNPLTVVCQTTTIYFFRLLLLLVIS